MPKRGSPSKPRLGTRQLADSVRALIESEAMESPALPDGRNPAAVMLGRLGGLAGGRARAEALSPERRREIARKAAAARWKNR